MKTTEKKQTKKKLTIAELEERAFRRRIRKSFRATVVELPFGGYELRINGYSVTHEIVNSLEAIQHLKARIETAIGFGQGVEQV